MLGSRVAQSGNEGEKRPVGRPTLYRDTMPDQARKLALLGATDEELADFWEVSIQTLYDWRERYPEFLEATRAGKQAANANVAERLYERAMGYSHPAVKIFMPEKANAPVYAEYTQHYPPDTAAASLWLRNRRPDLWRDKTEQALTVNDLAAGKSVEEIRRELVEHRRATGVAASPGASDRGDTG